MPFRPTLASAPIRAIVTALAVIAAPLAARAEISLPAQQGVLRALDDEYHAEAVYTAILAKFGAVRPFRNIVRAERVHAGMMIDILTSNGVAVPANPYLYGTKPVEPLPATIAEACAVGVQAEMANAKLYNDELLPAVSAYPQIVAAMTKLRDDSMLRHLPAFQRCVGRS